MAAMNVSVPSLQLCHSHEGHVKCSWVWASFHSRERMVKSVIERENMAVKFMKVWIREKVIYSSSLINGSFGGGVHRWKGKNIDPDELFWEQDLFDRGMQWNQGYRHILNSFAIQYSVSSNVKYHTLKLVVSCFQGDIGPFSASIPTDVPLWVAIFLKQRRKCRIQPPHWMDVGKCKTVTVISTIIYCNDYIVTAASKNTRVWLWVLLHLLRAHQEVVKDKMCLEMLLFGVWILNLLKSSSLWQLSNQA